MKELQRRDKHKSLLIDCYILGLWPCFAALTHCPTGEPAIARLCWSMQGGELAGKSILEIVWHDWLLPLPFSLLFKSKMAFKAQGKHPIFSFTKLQGFHPFNAIDLIFLILSAH